MISISDVMSRNIVAVQSDTPLEMAARLMANEKVGSLIILQNDEPVGIVTETDITRAFGKDAGSSDPVSKIMSSPLYSFTLDSDIMEVANAMRNNRIKKMPIIEGHKVLGIVTQTDIIRHIFRSLNTLCSAYNDGSLSCKEFAVKSATLFNNMQPVSKNLTKSWYMKCAGCGHSFNNPEVEGVFQISNCPSCGSDQIGYDKNPPT